MSIAQRTSDREDVTSLTPEQAEVAAMYEAGYDREAIGEQLQIETGTIDPLLSRIKERNHLAHQTKQECRYAFGGGFCRTSNIPSNLNSFTGAIVYYEVDDLVAKRYVLPAIREKHGHVNVEEVPLTSSAIEGGAAFRSLRVEEVPKVALLEDGDLVETVDIHDSRAVNRDLMNYLTVEQGPAVRARLGLGGEEPVELS